MSLSTLVRMTSKLVRHRSAQWWNAFAVRTHLRKLPATPTVIFVLVAGLAIPLAADVDLTPPALTTELAVRRLDTFERAHASNQAPTGRILDARPTLRWAPLRGARTYEVVVLNEAVRAASFRTAESVDGELTLPATTTLAPGSYRVTVRAQGPDATDETREWTFTVAEAAPHGDLLNPRPLCRWTPVPNAARYRARLLDENGRTIVMRVTTQTEMRVSPPAELAVGSYRLDVEALDAAGGTIGRRTSTFSMHLAPIEADALAHEAGLHLDVARMALWKAGYYAARGSEDDVVAALAYYLDVARPDDPGTGVARRILRAHGRS